MFTQRCRCVNLCTFVAVIFACAFGTHAKVVVQDGMEGAALNPLTPSLSTGQTYTKSSSASPFTSRMFGTSTMSGLLSDTSTTTTPSLYATVGATANDWVTLLFDFKCTGTNYGAAEFTAGESYTSCTDDFDLCFNSGRAVIYGRRPGDTASSFIIIPNVTQVEGDWYHVEARFSPSSFPDAYRTYSVTVTQNRAGTLVTGSLHALMQLDTNPINMFRIWGSLRYGKANVNDVYVDNVAWETYSQTDKILDGCFESPQTNPLTLLSGGTDATYTSYGGSTTIATNRFSTNTVCGDLNDASAALAPGLERGGLSITAKDYVHAQFDFKPLSGVYSQWSFILCDSGASAPHAVDLRFNGTSLAVFGKRRGGTAALINVPNVTVNTTSWYHVDILCAPAWYAANDRTYTMRVTQYDGANTYRGEVCDVLNEDSNPITVFKVLNSGPASNLGRLLVDNILVEALSDTASELRYGYLPSYNKIRSFVPFTPAYVSNWDIKLIRVSDSAQLAQQSGTLPYQAAGNTLNIPALANNTDYKVKLTLSGSGVTDDVIERTFTHKTFPETGNTLGKDDVLIPPFTAIVVNSGNMTVDTVLRTHTMSTAGLWSQVCSQNVDLLNAPMRLEVVSGGNTYPASGGGATFTTTTATRVTGSATWSAGPIANATTNFDYDYDGMMKVTLSLPTTSSPVDSLKLVIPMKSSESPYMHEITDNLRGHPSQSIPAGTGTVWTSANDWRVELPRPFVPYMWIGGAARGICWFAENDKDWIVNSTDAVIELNRNGGEVNLVVKFITVPGILTRARTINFGLMATPAKPMPTAPVNWRMWNQGFPPLNGSGINFGLLYSGYSWGQQLNCCAFYPAFKNFDIYNEYMKSRELGVNGGTAYRNNWLAQYPGDYPVDMINTYQAEVDYGLGLMRSRPRSSAKSTYMRDSMEGTQTLPLSIFSGDGNCSYTYVTSNPSPFLSSTFPTNTTSGLLVDNSTATNPGLTSSGFGITANDWVNVQFDFRPVSGDYGMWQFTIGDTAAWPYCCEVRFNGASLAIVGRRKTTDSIAYINIPNITVAAGDWYHVNILLSPTSFAAADRKYDITVTRQDSTGVRTYGTLRGILQEDINPINVFRCWHITNNIYTYTGQLQVDNVLVNTATPFWFIPYTNARGINWADNLNQTAEVGTYLDEWSIYDVADPRWDKAVKTDYTRMLRENATTSNYFSAANGHGLLTGVAYQVDPVPSFVDHMLYYNKKMLDTWADGIYWDDFFFQPNYNPVTGPGYIGDDGKVHAGVNIYGFRSLVKRAAIMQSYTMNMQPLLWPHITNTNFPPVLSFATMNLALEDYGSGNVNTDLQDRFGLDADCSRIFTEVTGFQSGNIGVIHNMFSGDHLFRTALAVGLIHECKVNGSNTNIFTAESKMTTFGYGQPDCTVFRYWDSTQSDYVTTTGATVKMLILKRPNSGSYKAYIVIGSFGAGGNVDFTLNPTSLGLPGGYTVYDDETGLAIPPIGLNQYQVTIPTHEFKLVRIQ